MTRPSDAIKQHNSFVVHEKSGGELFVKPSHFAVGYTPAYCATPREAIEYAMEKRAAQIRRLNEEVVELAQMNRKLDD